jgi:hypothetical protein
VKHFLKNILIIDRERSSSRAEGCRERVPLSTVSCVDIMLIEETTGYWIEKNQYGTAEYWFPKERLPEFLLDPTADYQPRTILTESIRDGGCSCHTDPPCSFCASLTRHEANIMANGGQEVLQRYWRETATV